MKWLTRAWAVGDLSDDDHEKRWSQYLAHRIEVLPRLSLGAERLLEVSLHDAQVCGFDYTPGGLLSFRALVGDIQVGYEFVELDYLEAHLHIEGDSTMESLNLFDAETEIIHDEVDVLHKGRFVHRVLLWPEGEFEVSFTSLNVRRLPATPSDRR